MIPVPTGGLEMRKDSFLFVWGKRAFSIHRTGKATCRSPPPIPRRPMQRFGTNLAFVWRRPGGPHLYPLDHFCWRLPTQWSPSGEPRAPSPPLIGLIGERNSTKKQNNRSSMPFANMPNGGRLNGRSEAAAGE